MTDDMKSSEETTAVEPVSRRAFNVKGFTSLLLTLVFTAVAFSGVILYLTPRGRTAHWTDWAMLGLGKDQWGTLHINTCAVLLLLATVHLLLNWKMFAGYVHKKAVGGLNLKREMALAGGLTALLLAGTILAWAPFNELADLNTRIKDSWETRVAEAPVPHSEELTLVRFAQQIHLPVEEMVSALNDEGFAVDDLNRTVGEVARQKGVAPSAVLAAIRKHHPNVAASQGGGQGRGMGMGQGMGRGRGGSSADASFEQRGTCSEGAGEPGSGRGVGRGMGGGMGQGMGQGMGRGRGMGWHADAEQTGE